MSLTNKKRIENINRRTADMEQRQRKMQDDIERIREAVCEPIPQMCEVVLTCPKCGTVTKFPDSYAIQTIFGLCFGEGMSCEKCGFSPIPKDRHPGRE